MKKTIKAILLTIGICLLWFVNSKFTTQQPTQTEITPTPEQAASTPALIKNNLYKIIKVIDGDTFNIDIDGRKETIRLIGVDSPETVDPRKPVQCFGKEASDKAKEVLTGKSVYLEADPSQGERDKYNRLLRYVFLEDGTNFNLFMISEGYAHEYTYQSIPYKYQQEFKNAQKSAMDNNRGLWAENACISTPTPTQQITISSSPIPDKLNIIEQSIEAPPTNVNNNSYACDCSKTCTQISSCDEAYFQLNNCGCKSRDSDSDGIPCESLCN